MISDNEIGRVVAVDTAQISIELNKDIKALTRSTYEGTYEVGSINSYIIVPIGGKRIVAMITRVVLAEESELKADKTMVSLPSTRRLMKATMIGTIEDDRFKQGISVFPVLDTPVLITTKKDLNAIFGNKTKCEVNDCADPGYCIPIGKSAIFPDYDIKINPDVFFGKHAAIIGSTGSGKSCTIATILQSILEQTDVKQTNFVILDTNGEYRSAFQKENADGNWISAILNAKSLYIPSDQRDHERLVVPYWFMDSDDFTRIFRAQPGVQRPVLLGALASARNSSGPQSNWIICREKIIREINYLIAASKKRGWPGPTEIHHTCIGFDKWLKSNNDSDGLRKLFSLFPNIDQSSILGAISRIKSCIGELNGDKMEYLDMQKEQDINDILKPILTELSRQPTSTESIEVYTSDTPRYFSKQDFRHQYIPDTLGSTEESSGRTRENCSTMLMRIYRLFDDPRFDFLFGPANSEWPEIKHSLATFIRDILGLESYDASAEHTAYTDSAGCAEKLLPFYDRQRTIAEKSNVVIVDLSLLSSEVLENVTALLGRLIHEFLQRVSDSKISGIERGGFPVVLVLEEAQNYIREGHRLEEESISKQVFERIAREGRKYGLGLVVASQRPSELSKTVLSQCNSFIVHRLQNPEDLRYFREIVPGIFDQMLDQLPALAPRTALVLGECVQAPAMAIMREVNPAPKSKNPKFYQSWTTDNSKIPDIEAVCHQWEGNIPQKEER